MKRHAPDPTSTLDVKTQTLDAGRIRKLFNLYDTNPVVQCAVQFYQNDLFSGRIICSDVDDPDGEYSQLWVQTAKDYLRSLACVGFAVFTYVKHKKYDYMAYVVDLTQVTIEYSKSYTGNYTFTIYERTNPGGPVERQPLQPIHVLAPSPPTHEGVFRSTMSILEPGMEDEAMRTQFAAHVDRIHANPPLITEEEKQTFEGEQQKSTWAMEAIGKPLVPMIADGKTNALQTPGQEPYARYMNVRLLNSLAGGEVQWKQAIANELSSEHRVNLAPGKKLVSGTPAESPGELLIQRDSHHEQIYNAFAIPMGMISAGGSKTTGKSGGSSEENNLYMFERAQHTRIEDLMAMIRGQRRLLAFFTGAHTEEGVKKAAAGTVVMTSKPNEKQLLLHYKMGNIPFSTLRKFGSCRLPEEYWNAKPALTLQEVNQLKEEGLENK